MPLRLWALDAFIIQSIVRRIMKGDRKHHCRTLVRTLKASVRWRPWATDAYILKSSVKLLSDAHVVDLLR